MWGGSSHLHLASSLYPGAEDGPHIKGQEEGAGEGGEEGGKLWRNQGKSGGGGGGGALDTLRNASRKNETSPTFLGNEAAAGQAAGLVHTGSEVPQRLQEERAALPAGQRAVSGVVGRSGCKAYTE